MTRPLTIDTSRSDGGICRSAGTADRPSHLEDQLGPAGEVVIEELSGDTGRLGDVPHGDVARPRLEEPARHAQDPIAGLV